MWKKIHDEQQNKNLHKKRVFEKRAPLPKITSLAELSLNYDPLLGFPFFIFGKRFYELQQLLVMFVFYLFFSLFPKIFIIFQLFLHSFLYLFLPTIDGHLEAHPSSTDFCVSLFTKRCQIRLKIQIFNLKGPFVLATFNVAG